jgi:hypothetical protein
MKGLTAKQKKCKHKRVVKQQKIVVFGIVEVEFCLDCFAEVNHAVKV